MLLEPASVRYYSLVEASSYLRLLHDSNANIRVSSAFTTFLIQDLFNPGETRTQTTPIRIESRYSSY
jgi:hypothetical protein